MQLFHAGVGITLPFLPFTHFGTRQAALDRLKNTVKNHSDLSQIALLEVTFDDTELNIIDSDDIGSPRPFALMKMLIPNEVATRRRVQAEIDELRLRTDIDQIQIKRAERYIVLEVVAHTCDALRYVNDHEDFGQPSYCIFRPSFRTIRRIDAQQISCNEAVLDLLGSYATITLLNEPIHAGTSVRQNSNVTTNQNVFHLLTAD